MRGKEGKEAHNWGIHPGFETQDKNHQKSKTAVLVAPQKGVIVMIVVIWSYLIFLCRYLDTYVSAHHGLEENEINGLDLATLRLKRKRTTQRKDTYSPRPDSSTKKLGQCLLINRKNDCSSTLPNNVNHSGKQLDSFKPQFGKKETKKMQNGVYASAPGGSRISESSSSIVSGHTYKFTSIDSYLKYNNHSIRQEGSRSPVKCPIRVPIPREVKASVISQTSGSSTNRQAEKYARPKHRMKTISRMTSARTSDIAALGDLDEYFVVTTPHFDQRSLKSMKSGKSTKSNMTDDSSDKDPNDTKEEGSTEK